MNETKVYSVNDKIAHLPFASQNWISLALMVSTFCTFCNENIVWIAQISLAI